MFLSNENKAMVWQLLADNGAFTNIPESYYDRVKTLYENTITQISTMYNENLTDKNKLAIQTMMEKLPYLKNKVVTKPLEEVELKLNKEFENKQEEFLKLVKHPTPEEVKFNEDNDEPLDKGDMDDMLNDMMKQREAELNQVQPSQNLDSFKEFEEIGENSPNQLVENQLVEGQPKEDQPKEYNIRETQLVEGQLKEKRVSFDTDFIGKLKKLDMNNSTNSINKPEETESTTELLYQVLENQKLIMRHLRTLSRR